MQLLKIEKENFKQNEKSFILTFDNAPEITQVLEISQVTDLIKGSTNYYLSKVKDEPLKLRLTLFSNKSIIFN